MKRANAAMRDGFQHKGPFSVITVGTGAPRYSPERSGPCALVHYRRHYFLVDMGNGTQARLHEANIRVGDLEAFLFTHFHLDHSEEFIPLLINAWLQGQDNLKIIGPPGVKEYHAFLLSFYKEDIAYRARRTGRPVEKITDIEIKELTGENAFELNGVSVRTTEVPHTIYTLAYRFDAGGKSIVISGDLTYSENLIQLARAADVVVMDSGGYIRAKQKQGAPQRKGPPRRSGGGNKGRMKAHPSSKDVATMPSKARVKKLVLTHFAPGVIDREATSRVIGEIFKGEVLFGEDLMEVVP
ncbi:MAG: MBL fold metallo-hydrolase [Deltaproteobacteria bacterium]|nr:MBL fold metallo-hydrolase [Deltaproteobacteria bacterium]